MNYNKYKHLVQLSGGVGSWAAAKRVVAEFGSDDVLLIFADVLMEDEDLYRFMEEAIKNIGADYICLKDGRTPWQVFHDVRFLGNSRVDPCSSKLKRDLLNGFINDNFKPEDVTIHYGIDWTEIHRFEGSGAKRGIQARMLPWKTRAPLCEPPYLDKSDIIEWVRSEGIEPRRLYALGFPHNNCGGFCVKAGHGQFKLLLEKLPERYAQHEKNEEDLREYLGKDVAVMRSRIGGVSRPLTMREFRENIEKGKNDGLDLLEYGGCGCAIAFSDDEV